ncbi:hypothetical protein SELMODRAFT_410336 [Selaginella moellendorffii]|uniref:Topo IA-type catalytic domain-containing protein n=1 Tax=Selaginella moellendorffii TaxID=88036 RepID=D8REF7_SELML|nr:hypothetical protein SELMODRAFT_410336 [Selaginella moellendorffii]
MWKLSAFLSCFFTEFVDYSFTAKMEEQVDAVSSRSMKWKEVLQQFWPNFHDKVAATAKVPTQQSKMNHNAKTASLHLQDREPGWETSKMQRGFSIRCPPFVLEKWLPARRDSLQGKCLREACRFHHPTQSAFQKRDDFESSNMDNFYGSRAAVVAAPDSFGSLPPMRIQAIKVLQITTGYNTLPLLLLIIFLLFLLLHQHLVLEKQFGRGNVMANI